MIGFLLALQGYARLHPLYLYTAANRTIYLILHDDQQPIPQVWEGNQVSSSAYYSGNAGNASAVARNNARTVIIDPSIAAYQWGTVAHLFANHGAIERIEGLEHLKIDTYTTNLYQMFFMCRSLQELDLSHFNTENVTTMEDMFYNCNALTRLDLTDFKTSKVTTVKRIFYGCKALTNLDVSHFVTSSMVDMSFMFTECYALTELNLANFVTDNVTTMSTMFYDCRSLTKLDLRSFNTEKVTDMNRMFYGMASLKELDLSSFNTDNVVNMWRMFYACPLFTTFSLSHFNTERVTNMEEMFANCTGLKTLNLNNFNGRSLSRANNFLAHASNLEYVDLSKATGFNDLHLNQIVNSVPNVFTLKYLPKGSAVRGANVINNDGTNFTSVEYVVADDTLQRYTDATLLTPNTNSAIAMKWEVNIPYGFTANKVTNTRTVGAKAGSAYTWFMPYSAPIPAGVEVYEFKASTVDGKVATFVRSNDVELKAQKPYLVKSTLGAISTSVDATSEVPAYTPGSDVVVAETSDGWSFIGSFQWRTAEKAAEEGLHTLQTGNKWKHYEGSTAKPRPFRAYLKKAMGSGARELSVNFEDGSGITGIEKIELLDGNTPESNSIYDLNGRYLGTRRDVLPTGTYIIGGKTTRI